MLNRYVVDEGLRVKVIAIPTDEDYADCMDKHGTLMTNENEIGWNQDELDGWVLVLLDGDIVPCEFLLSELDELEFEEV